MFITFCLLALYYKRQENIMELKRKIDNFLEEWKASSSHKPLTVMGIRQSGKTFSINRFAKTHYDNVFYLNFMTNPEAKEDFFSSLDVNDLLPALSLRNPKISFIPHKTVFFFDEIQDCPRARLSLKSFAIDGRFDVIASGSYLGIKGYVVVDGTPLPVGYEDIYTMHTMDFEEFLWANGYGEEQIRLLRNAFDNKTPLSSTAMQVFSALYKQYLCVGGFPEAVSLFIDTRNLQTALNKVKSISIDLENDFGRRIGKDGKPLFKPEEVARIRSAYDLIPTFLGKENKRYIVSKVGTGKNAEQKKDAIAYLEDAGIIVRSFNVDSLSTPLSGGKRVGEFKIFPSDIGLLISMEEPGTVQGILKGNLGIGKGAIFEGLVADALFKNGSSLFYFARTPNLEVDFVINVNGLATMLEVKSENGNAKSAKTILSNPSHYGKSRLFKIINGNISFENGVFSFPHFLTFLIHNDDLSQTAEDLSYNVIKEKLGF